MDLFIKMQKARHLIARNGLMNGGKIVLGYLKNYAKAFYVGSGEILFVTGGVGDKAHYRAYGVAEELEMHGFGCAVTGADIFQLKQLVSHFKIFVLHKISYDSKIENFIEEIKKQNKKIIFDTDDLDFDPQYLPYMEYLSNISPAEKEEYKKGIGVEIVNDSYVKAATTTVEYLADKIREKKKEVFVVSNKISNYELEIAEKILSYPKTQDGQIRIGYYSGTMSHNKDFATIIPAIVAVLEKYKNVKLVLAGPLEAENELKKFVSRIELLPRVTREKYYVNLAKCDINLAPLEMHNPFCEAKSEIKFIEAGILSIPTVSVDNRTFHEAIIDGEDGFLAAKKEDWVEKISYLVEDEKIRRDMGKKARLKILRDYTNKNSHNEKYYAYLRAILEKIK